MLNDDTQLGPSPVYVRERAAQDRPITATQQKAIKAMATGRAQLSWEEHGGRPWLVARFSCGMELHVAVKGGCLWAELPPVH